MLLDCLFLLFRDCSDFLFLIVMVALTVVVVLAATAGVTPTATPTPTATAAAADMVALLPSVIKFVSLVYGRQQLLLILELLLLRIGSGTMSDEDAGRVVVVIVGMLFE